MVGTNQTERAEREFFRMGGGGNLLYGFVKGKIHTVGKLMGAH